jgi:hypothetical protein
MDRDTEPRPQGGWYVTNNGKVVYIEQETIDNVIDVERIEPEHVFEFLKYVHDWDFDVTCRVRGNLPAATHPRRRWSLRYAA